MWDLSVKHAMINICCQQDLTHNKLVKLVKCLEGYDGNLALFRVNKKHFKNGKKWNQKGHIFKILHLFDTILQFTELILRHDPINLKI
jgi:hypothetical protein